MNACDCIFPSPRQIRQKKTSVTIPARLALQGVSVPAWLRARLNSALKALDSSLAAVAESAISLELAPVQIKGDFSEAQQLQSYKLIIEEDGSVKITAPGAEGIRHGLLSLCQMLKAGAAGAELRACTVMDIPVFAVRGLHIDLAREFFPPLPYLKKIIDRMADLKFNTVWLYFENHFHAPGLEDVSQPGGITVAQAQEISAYGAGRGIDVVPATNVLSHMEGFLRLERYSDFVDGSNRSYPVLTDKRAWELVKKFLDGVLKGFPSPNFHPGLDELLFTGSHPEAVKAIQKKGKPAYFADFACKVIDYLQKHGKRVWIWDDMVLGKNINRVEGFKDEYQKALDRIPKDVVMTHWYYWTNFDGIHGPIMERVGKAGRPFVVSPNSMGSKGDAGNLSNMFKVNQYMANCGEKYGAFGFVCTMWQYTEGCSYEACWPFNALTAEFAWCGSKVPEQKAQHAMALAVTDDAAGLVEYLHAIDAIQQRLNAWELGPGALRHTLFTGGPHKLWRRFQAVITPARRQELRKLLAAAETAWGRIGNRDPGLRQALALHMTLFNSVLQILDAFDAARSAYHQAALLEREPGKRPECRASLNKTAAELNKAVNTVNRYAAALEKLNRSTGHDPYDVYVLKEWARLLKGVPELMNEVYKSGVGLPYFEKLLYLPDAYKCSNLMQLKVYNKFFSWLSDDQRVLIPPPVSWEGSIQ